MNTYGIRGIAHSCFKSYLSDRNQFVVFKSHYSQKLPIACGVPQGSILGPLLFLIYINDIVNTSSLLSYILFADDTNLFFSHKNLNTLKLTLNVELNKVTQWFKCNKLSLNLKKTNYMLFRTVHTQENIHVDTRIDNEPLVKKDNTKFLGIFLILT